MRGPASASAAAPPRTRTRRSAVGRILAGALATGAIGALASTSPACKKYTPPIICTYGSTLIITSTETVLNAAPYTATIHFTVAAQADQRSPCGDPVPVSTTVTLDAGCVPGGSTVSQTFAHGGPVLSDSIDFVFDVGPDRTCTLTGTAVTTWSNGVVTSATSTTGACLVSPVPSNPGVPRLEVELISGAGPVAFAHAGGQVTHRYRVTNHDPLVAATIDLTGQTEQVSRLPVVMGGPGPAGALSFAAPTSGDHFPVQFREDIGAGLAPDFCYVRDDGGAEDAIGQDAGGGGLVWLNSFTVVPGAETIDQVDLMFGSDVDGFPARVLVYDDPNDDGDPSDAVLLSQTDITAANAGAGVFNTYPIAPVTVGGAGDRFFVGAVMQELGDCNAGGGCPAAFDIGLTGGETAWIAGSNAQCATDIDDLTANDFLLEVTAGTLGQFMIRACGNVDDPCIVLPSPVDPALPTITQSLRLCPGDSREVELVTRSWGPCTSGSCSRLEVGVEATYDDGAIVRACTSSGHMVDNSEPAQLAWPDSTERLCLLDVIGPQMIFGANGPGGPVGLSVQFDGQMQIGGVLAEPLPMQGGVLLDDFGGKPRWGRLEQELLVLPPQPFPTFDAFASMQLEPIGGGGGPLSIAMAMVFPPDPDIKPSDVLVKVVTEGPEPGAFAEWLLQLNVGSDSFGTGVPGFVDPASVEVQVEGSQLLVSFGGHLQAEVELVQLSLDATVGARGLALPDPCPGDITGDFVVGFDDLLTVLASWGPIDDCPPSVPADLDGDCDVDFSDLLVVLAAWGPCS